MPPKGEYRRHIHYVSGSRIPDTDMQALMESMPHQDPITSRESSAPLRDRLADAVDSLPDRLQWIFEARHYRGMSIRQIAAELNLAKSYVGRLYEQARQLLAAELDDLMVTFERED